MTVINGNGISGATLPECWGHRGASARFPENTLASFEAAIRDGAEGIESDVHVSLDGVVVMFHDPVLERTTDATGKIRERDWYGVDGMEHVRTIKEPKQSIPTFAETVALLMKPENLHCKFNVDVKVQNSPAKLFSLMNDIITAQPNWEKDLAPRILLGLWHPLFVPEAKEKLPYLERSYIGRNLRTARTYFWDDCNAFSIHFNALVGSDGEKFREECKTAGKKLLVWTVNAPESMMEATRWGVNAILTDHTQRWLDLRAELQKDYNKVSAKYSRSFLYTSIWFYPPSQWALTRLERWYLESIAGPFGAAARRIETTA